MVNIQDKAPNFKAKALVNGEEKEISLLDYIGKRVVVYFYPRDLTPGCTTQACNIRDNWSKFQNEDIVVLGISTDDIKSHKKFAEKKELPFILVDDSDKKIVKDYGVYGEKKFMGKTYLGTSRKTFLIDKKGVIVHIIENPKVGEHSKEILDFFNNN